MTAPLLVGLDVGTSAVKAIAIDGERGEVIASASRPLDLDAPRPGFAEQDPRAYVSESLAALAALAHQLGSRRDAVASIGLSGQMHTAVFLDAARLPLGPAMLWCDGRASVECAEIFEAVGAERLAATVGNRPLEGFTLPKLLWLRRHQPEIYARVDRVVMPKDFVRYRLTGELATDVSDASGTLAFEPKSGRWSDEVLDRVGAPRDVLADRPRLGGDRRPPRRRRRVVDRPAAAHPRRVRRRRQRRRRGGSRRRPLGPRDGLDRHERRRPRARRHLRRRAGSPAPHLRACGAGPLLPDGRDARGRRRAALVPRRHVRRREARRRAPRRRPV